MIGILIGSQGNLISSWKTGSFVKHKENDFFDDDTCIM